MRAEQRSESLPPPGEHGDDAGRVAEALGLRRDAVLDLATSLNPVAPDVRLTVAASLRSLRSYPDSRVATAAMAGALGADPGQVLLTNGGAEAIALLAEELGSGAVDEPEFSLYRRHLPRVDPAAGRWRSNPHNPTGRLAPDDESAAVWDEAFYPLATGAWTRGDHRRGSVVVGSLTKVFACPGLRLGYVLAADEALVARLARRQAAWAVSSLALGSLPRLLEIADLERYRREVAELRRALCSVLASHGLSAEPSDANFVLVRGGGPLRELLAPEGVVVRDCASLGLPGATRIAVPDEEGLGRLDGALGRALGASRRPPAPTSAPRRPREGGKAGGPAGALLVCGTSSDAGKSQLVAGLCRLLARRGVRVAPFKAQNMSLNSYATSSGHEIGRAQGLQAIAAGVDAEAAMNPILLKPTTGGRSQVVVMGEPLGELDAASYHATRKAALLPTVLDAFWSLRERFDVVLCEGAGSPAEVNLLEGDLANLGFAAAAQVPAVLVGDIDRGGVFASLAGTFVALPESLRSWLKAFVVNKFRGDAALLGPGLRFVEELTGWPCAGVVPHLGSLRLDAEDSLGLGELVGEARPGALLDVAVVALPHIANFTDLDALAAEPDVSLRLVESASGLGHPDLLVLPGSKSTVDDLAWMRRSGLAGAVLAAAREPSGPVVLGVCAGYQMLGSWIEDEYESGRGGVEGLCLLPVVTTFGPEKRTRPRSGSALCEPVAGYEIHQGDVTVAEGARGEPLAWLEDSFGSGPEGWSVDGGRVVGTSLHGLFESDAFRERYLASVAARRGRSLVSAGLSHASSRQAQIDLVADALEEALDTGLLFSLLSLAAVGRPVASEPS